MCRQSTVIPSSNLIDGLKNTAHGLAQSSKKVFYDVSGKPYVTCTRCNAHVKTGGQPLSTAQAAPASAAAAAVGGEVGVDGGAAAAEAPVGGAPAAVAGGDAPGAPSVEQLNVVEGSINPAGHLVCPSCKNEIDM